LGKNEKPAIINIIIIYLEEIALVSSKFSYDMLSFAFVHVSVEFAMIGSPYIL